MIGRLIILNRPLFLSAATSRLHILSSPACYRPEQQSKLFCFHDELPNVHYRCQFSSQPGSRYEGSWNDGIKMGSALLPSLGVAALVGFVFALRWYVNRIEDEPVSREERKPALHDEVDTDLKSLSKSGLSLVSGSDDTDRTEFAQSGSSISANGDTKPVSVDAEPIAEPEQSPSMFVDRSKIQFPTHVRYLIVGAGTAGLAAARAIRASDPKSKILMVAGGCGPGDDSAEPGITETDSMEPPPYLRPPLSKELWRRSKQREQKLLQPFGDVRRHSWLYYEAESFFFKPEDLASLEYGGVALHRGDPVVHLHPDTHTAVLSSGRKVTYERCLLATGGRPKRLEHLEVCPDTKRNLVELGFISYFRNLADYKRLRELVEKYRKIGGKIAVVGGGFLGSELTVSLLTVPTESSENTVEENKPSTPPDESHLSVLHVFRESQPMGHVLPPCLACATARFETNKNAELCPSSSVVSISLLPSDEVNQTTDCDNQMGSRNKRVRLRIRQSGMGEDVVKNVDVDHIVCVVGVQPNTELANEAGLELDPNNGGFLVNAEMEARSGVFVAGDAASYWDPVLRCRRRVEHLNFAEETGALAGKNMAAAYEPLNGTNDSAALREVAPYQFQSSLWSSLGRDVSWDAVGDLDCRKLITRSYFVASQDGNSSDMAEDTERKQSIPSSEFGRLNHGVVFYLTPNEKRLVGILLWNLPDDIYSDNEFAAPSRLNLARSILAQRIRIGQHNEVEEEEELRILASQFDLTGELAKDYEDLKLYTDAKKQELLASLDLSSSETKDVDEVDPSIPPVPNSTEQ